MSLEGKTWGDIGKISERYREDIGKISGRGISRNISEYFSDLQILAETPKVELAPYTEQPDVEAFPFTLLAFSTGFVQTWMACVLDPSDVRGF